jgi:hypothetical protein
MSKTDLWDRLGKTDPKHTKPFKRAGGFSGTAIKPIYSILRMTQEFGACGNGWGINEPSFQVVQANDETLVYCTVSIWYGAKENVVFGVGGDKVVAKFSSGLKSDDEAFKKAFTDAVGNAMKFMGMSADVHMGMFDDSKYVASLRENPHVTRPSDVFEPVEYDQNGEVIDNIPSPSPEANKKLRIANQRPVFAELQKEIQSARTVKDLTNWAAVNKDRLGELKPDWQDFLRGVYAEHLIELRNKEAA